MSAYVKVNGIFVTVIVSSSFSKCHFFTVIVNLRSSTFLFYVTVIVIYVTENVSLCQSKCHFMLQEMSVQVLANVSIVTENVSLCYGNECQLMSR